MDPFVLLRGRRERPFLVFLRQFQLTLIVTGCLSVVLIYIFLLICLRLCVEILTLAFSLGGY